MFVQAVKSVWKPTGRRSRGLTRPFQVGQGPTGACIHEGKQHLTFEKLTNIRGTYIKT